MKKDEVRFDGRAIVVTGAARGLGRAYALLLAARGARVVVADNGVTIDGRSPDPTPADSVVAEIKEAGGEAVACAADLSEERGSIEAIETSLHAFGRIDGILHNASISPLKDTVENLSTPDSIW